MAQESYEKGYDAGWAAGLQHGKFVLDMVLRDVEDAVRREVAGSGDRKRAVAAVEEIRVKWSKNA